MFKSLFEQTDVVNGAKDNGELIRKWARVVLVTNVLKKATSSAFKDKVMQIVNKVAKQKKKEVDKVLVSELMGLVDNLFIQTMYSMDKGSK